MCCKGQYKPQVPAMVETETTAVTEYFGRLRFISVFTEAEKFDPASSLQENTKEGNCWLQPSFQEGRLSLSRTVLPL